MTKRSVFSRVLLAASCICLCGGAAQANIVGLTNTGVNVGPGAVDQSWAIVGGSNSLGSPYAGSV